MAIYAASLVAAFAWYAWSRLAHLEERYLDARALAEAMRVQIFWRLAALQHVAADYYLRRQHGVLTWIRAALRAWLLPRGGGHRPSPAESAVHELALVRQRWIEDQLTYFTRTARRYRGISRSLKRVGNTLLAAGVVLAVLRFAVEAGMLASIAVTILPITAAVLLVYERTRALSVHANQYSRMAQLFADASRRLAVFDERGDTAAAQQVVLDLGREALAENAEWLTLHRDRPLESPNLG